jgi:energy-coupling factor transporter ATP-binding protein EcfA2
MTLQIKKATKKESKARIALCGPSGSGKTYTANLIARGLVGPEGRILVFDTARGSASKYSDVFQFDVIEPDEFSPQTYVEAVELADKNGYDAIIIDSLSHAWSGKGGALEMVDNITKRSKSTNSFTAWRDVTPEHNKLIDAMIGARCHVIVTMRTKTEWVLEEDSRGKKVPRKIGMQYVQRDGMEYEFDIVADIDLDHTLIVSKSRCRALDEKVIKKPNGEIADMLRDWLSGEPVTNAEPKLSSTPKQPAQKPAPDGNWQRIGKALETIYPGYEKHERFAALREYAAWVNSGGSKKELEELAQHCEAIATPIADIRLMVAESNPGVPEDTVEENLTQFLAEMIERCGRKSILEGDPAELESWVDDLKATMAVEPEEEAVV